MALTRTSKIIAVGILGGGVFAGLWYYQKHGTTTASVDLSTVEAGELQDFKEAEQAPAPANAEAFVLPAAAPAKGLKGAPIVVETISWMAMHGHNLAVGGIKTTQGSLAEKYGVNVTVKMNNDYPQMRNSLVACAQKLKGGAKSCGDSATHVNIMGDAAAAFIAAGNGLLEKIGPEYRLKVIALAGSSYGEDKFLAPANVSSAHGGDPQNARGLLISGVPADGDWNLAVDFGKANGICNNPDHGTYDPNCLNWAATSSVDDANKLFINAACEDRPVVNNGKKTGETKNVCVNAVVTWFPGDELVVKKKGGVVNILSTRENSAQMPATIIGIDAFNQANHETVKNYVRAVLEGGEAIKRGGPTVLKAAGAISAKVFPGYGDADYWTKYFRGNKTVEDSAGNEVNIGGSRVFNLANNLQFFGLDAGATNYFEATYTRFGNFVVANYPSDLPSFAPASSVVDLSFVQELAAEADVNKGKAEEEVFEEGGADATATIGTASHNITFKTGSAVFSSDAYPVLTDVQQQLVVTNRAYVKISGHTDDVGNDASNLVLSKARAQAVADYLKQKAPGAFSEGRVTVEGLGETAPKVPNTNEAARAKNRRVDITLISK